MFWRFSFGTLSYVDELLNRDGITFQALVESEECTVEDIVQEVKARNHKLLNLITETETIESLLRSMLQPPASDGSVGSEDSMLHAKYVRVACEVFCCESQEICDTIAKSNELIAMLFSFVEPDVPLHNALAGYFGRVVCSLLYKCGTETLKYLEENRHVLGNLLKHTGSSSVGEVIIRVAASDEKWVGETDLIENLLEKLGPNEPLDVQVKAAEVLCGINTDIYQFSNPVKQKLYSRGNIERLCKCAFGTTEQIMVPAIMVFTNLLVGVGRCSEEEDGMADHTDHPTGVEVFRSTVFEIVLSYAYQIVALLDVASDARVQHMPYGVIRPTFGIARLRVVELLRVLLWIAGAEVEEALIASKAIQRCLESFLQYPFNNLLHSSVEGLVTFALDDITPRLADHLVLEYDLATFVAEAPIVVEPEPLPNTGSAKKLRAGYAGHLTRIANKLQERAMKSSAVADRLNSNAKWQSFVQTTLDDCNRKDDIESWECGRPSQEMGREEDGMAATGFYPS